MKIDYIKVGYLRCNCYLLESDGECLLIDPGDDIDAIMDFISGKNVIGILVTPEFDSFNLKILSRYYKT